MLMKVENDRKKLITNVTSAQKKMSLKLKLFSSQ